MFIVDTSSSSSSCRSSLSLIGASVTPISSYSSRKKRGKRMSPCSRASTSEKEDHYSQPYAMFLDFYLSCTLHHLLPTTYLLLTTWLRPLVCANNRYIWKSCWRQFWFRWCLKAVSKLSQSLSQSVSRCLKPVSIETHVSQTCLKGVSSVSTKSLKNR